MDQRVAPFFITNKISDHTMERSLCPPWWEEDTVTDVIVMRALEQASAGRGRPPGAAQLVNHKIIGTHQELEGGAVLQRVLLAVG